MCVPEGEDDQASDDEDCSKYNEDVVTGISPPSIVEHLCRLSEANRKEENLFNKEVADKWIIFCLNNANISWFASIPLKITKV